MLDCIHGRKQCRSVQKETKMSTRVNYKANESITSTSEMNVLSCQKTEDGFSGVIVFDADAESVKSFLCDDNRFVSFSIKA
jgi:hypothetical protein